MIDNANSVPRVALRYKYFRAGKNLNLKLWYIYMYMCTHSLGPTHSQSQQPLSPPMMVPSQLSPGPNQQVQGTCTNHIVVMYACTSLHVQI
jgi:hypothetical protein